MRPLAPRPELRRDEGETRGFSPVLARTRTVQASIAPIAFDCIKLIFVRDGSAILLSEFGQQAVTIGDVVVLAGNTLCGGEPEGHVTFTTVYLDSDYVIDQVFWQYADILADRLDAQQFAAAIYSEPAQVLRIGEDRAGMLMPWLDELVMLTLGADLTASFYRMQSRLFAVVDVIAPFIVMSPTRLTPTQRARTRPTLPRWRRFHPLRVEAIEVRALLRGAVGEPWSLATLAERVHLSPKQLSRVFADTYGKTPLAYLTMLRVQEMARLLRESDLSIAEAGRRVGWSSRSRAAQAFRECVGVTPSEYRRMGTDAVA